MLLLRNKKLREQNSWSSHRQMMGHPLMGKELIQPSELQSKTDYGRLISTEAEERKNNFIDLVTCAIQILAIALHHYAKGISENTNNASRSKRATKLEMENCVS